MTPQDEASRVANDVVIKDIENMGSNSISTPSDGESNSAIHSNLRSKTDVAWRYISESQDQAGRKSFTCNFCLKTFRGGGINRMKQHLAGVKGNIGPCLKVPRNVRLLIQGNLEDYSSKAKKKLNGSTGIHLHYLDEVEEFEAQTTDSQPTQANVRKRKASSNLQSYFKKGIRDLSQPSIKSAMDRKERFHDADLALAMWFYDACIPMNAVNSPFFPIAISKIANAGHGYTGPSYHAMRVTLLKDAKQSVELIIDSYRKNWSENGCTIMSDGWRDSKNRPLINFLVYCSKGISFIKSVDASDIESNAQTLCNLFGDIVEIVGPKNVVHIVTENAPNYKAAGRLLRERYPSIYWSPCSAHCINLIMKDIGDLSHVAKLIGLASRITVFIYNHKWPLNWLRKRSGWTEIIRPSATHFVTAFIALRSLYDHKEDLQAMVTSTGYKKFLKLPRAMEVKLIILDETFWKNCLITVNVIGPLLRLLRICDSDEKPALGYVYEGMYRAKKGIKELFRFKKDLYKPYTNIIKARWDGTLRKGLFATAYWLNPFFQYDRDNFCKKREVFSSVLDLIEDKATDEALQLTSQLLSQLLKFQDCRGSFGESLAFASQKCTCPDEWWKLFGEDCPELQKFAIRILSQNTSSSGCERNRNVFEIIHTKRRNRVEHQRLNDLVYVHYNLRLQNRLKYDKRCYDPLDYECIDKTEFWVVEEETEGELDLDELDNMIEEEPQNTNEPSSSQEQGSKQNDDDDIALLDDVDLASYKES